MASTMSNTEQILCAGEVANADCIRPDKQPVSSAHGAP